MEKNKENTITLRITGKYALFTDPITKIGGEKSTLMLPTYQALKGILESMYWKPSIIWYVDKVCIVNSIMTETKGIRPIKYNEEGNDLSFYTYLTNVEYIVEAHFEFNKNRMDLKDDFNVMKHSRIAKRSLEKGGRRDIFLGTRECQGYIEPCKFSNEKSCYKELAEMDFGFQYHSLSYPDENGEGKLIANFWNPKMEKGIIEFRKPSECDKRRKVRDMNKKEFSNQNFENDLDIEMLKDYKEGDSK